MDTNEDGFHAGSIDSDHFKWCSQLHSPTGEWDQVRKPMQNNNLETARPPRGRVSSNDETISERFTTGLTEVKKIEEQRRTLLMQTLRCASLLTLTLVLHVSLLAPASRAAGMKLGDMCRLKGQETNTLQGLGLVVGLRGTGDSDAAPTARALARMMQLMGGPIAINAAGQLNLDDVADAKNVAMVFVTATIPAAGAQPGDLLNVSVNAINAKSLDGGTLMLTPMLGPRADNPTVYAMAQGRLNVSLDGPATTATIQGGAKMEAAVEASFQRDGLITLVLEKDLASFDTAQLVEEEIINFSALTHLDSPNSGSAGRPRAARSIKCTSKSRSRKLTARTRLSSSRFCSI